MGALVEWVLGVRGALPVLLQGLLGLGKVATLSVAVIKVAVLSTAVIKVAPVLEGVVVKVASSWSASGSVELRGRRASRK